MYVNNNDNYLVKFFDTVSEQEWTRNNTHVENDGTPLTMTCALLNCFVLSLTQKKILLTPTTIVSILGMIGTCSSTSPYNLNNN